MRLLGTVLGLSLLASVAHATSHHEEVLMTPIKNKAGTTTGVKIAAVLSGDPGHTHARFGLLPAKDKLPKTGFTLKTEIMAANSKHFLVVSPDVAMHNNVNEVEITVDYAKHGIKSGDKMQLGSVWHGEAAGSNGSHLYGPTWNTWGDPEVEMP